MMVDTDVLVWYMRGNLRAKKAIDGLDAFSISAVVYMELVQGIRNNAELLELKKFLRERGIACLALDADITSRAMFLMEKYSLSHGLRMADALIAATADIRAEELLTANTAHYKMIPGLLLKRFRPNHG